MSGPISTWAGMVCFRLRIIVLQGQCLGRPLQSKTSEIHKFQLFIQPLCQVRQTWHGATIGSYGVCMALNASFDCIW